MRFRWPGNVRSSRTPSSARFWWPRDRTCSRRTCPSRFGTRGSTTSPVPPHHTLAEIERLTILQTLQRTNWTKQEAASILGIYRPTLYSKMRKHDIRDPRAVAAGEPG